MENFLTFHVISSGTPKSTAVVPPKQKELTASALLKQQQQALNPTTVQVVTVASKSATPTTSGRPTTVSLRTSGRVTPNSNTVVKSPDGKKSIVIPALPQPIPASPTKSRVPSKSNSVGNNVTPTTTSNLTTRSGSPRTTTSLSKSTSSHESEKEKEKEKAPSSPRKRVTSESGSSSNAGSSRSSSSRQKETQQPQPVKKKDADNDEAARETFRTSISQAFLHRIQGMTEQELKEIPKGNTAESMGEAMEEELFLAFGSLTNQKYRNKCRSILFNLK